MKQTILLSALSLLPLALHAEVKITEANGWLETAYVKWQPTPEAKGYNVYCRGEEEADWVRLDKELIRDYGDYGRADALGLKAGKYEMRVVPTDAIGQEITAEAATTPLLNVQPHDRTGFAHHGRGDRGVGAYNNDGTLKAGTRVFYVWADNAKTITHTFLYDASTGKTKTYTGFQTLLDGYRKCIKADPDPICIRLIGMIRDTDMDKFLSSAEGLAVKGEQPFSDLPITIEGVGDDATIWGFGIQVSQCTGVELRNFGIMLCMDDGLSVASNNSYIWMHNLDVYYGQVGSDADQVKGDGAIDIKLSQYCTVSYCRFHDCGKCSLVDASSVATGYADFLTYHHNWFDHSDQRNPRLRNGSRFHIYNNYYDGNGLYGVGMACGSSALVEGNYFRHCRYPVIASGQGTDKGLVDSKQSKKGLLSGENGGIVKWWNNYVEGADKFTTQQESGHTQFDAYAVTSRLEQVPADIKTYKGNTPYSNFDTDAHLMYASQPDDPMQVPAIVTGHYGAGRCNHSDFWWTYDNATEDLNCELIPALKQALVDYRSSLVGFFGQKISNGGGSAGLAQLQADCEPHIIYNIYGQRVRTKAKGLVVKSDKKAWIR